MIPHLILLPIIALGQWSNDTHVLPCPGNSASLGGFVIKLKNPDP